MRCAGSPRGSQEGTRAAGPENLDRRRRRVGARSAQEPPQIGGVPGRIVRVGGGVPEFRAAAGHGMLDPGCADAGDERRRASGSADRFASRASDPEARPDRKSTRLNSSHVAISYAVFCLKKKKKQNKNIQHLKINNDLVR